MYARGYYICLLVNGHQLAIAHTMYLRVQSIFEFQVSSSNLNSCTDSEICDFLQRMSLRRCVMCGRTCACEIHSEKCAGCACVWLVFGRAICDHNFAHFLQQNWQKMLLFVLKTILERTILF